MEFLFAMAPKQSIRDLISEEQKFADSEFQIKLKASVSEDKLREIKAIRLGSVLHSDVYYIKKGDDIKSSSELIRIRKEGNDEMIFTFKGKVSKFGENKLIKRIVLDRKLKGEHLLDIKKNYKEVIRVNKKRTMFLRDGVLICVDEVEHLGDYIEFTGRNKRSQGEMDEIILKLGLDIKTATKRSYFELSLNQSNVFDRFLHRAAEKAGKYSYGICSGVLTTLGIIVGLNSATASELAVLSGIAVIAFCDSLSDAMGMYASKRTERGNSSKSALTAALNTFIGKVVFTLTFMVPFILLGFDSAVIASIVWGLLLLTFVSFEISFMQHENLFKTVFKNLGTGVVIIVSSHYIGHLIEIII